jgi:hypothetical protein
LWKGSPGKRDDNPDIDKGERAKSLGALARGGPTVLEECMMSGLVADIGVDPGGGAWVAIAGVLGIGAIILANAVYQSSRAKRAMLDRERAAQAEQARQVESQQQQQSRQREREEGAYQQHIRLQELTARKLDLEARLLTAQAENIDRDRQIREKNAEYHELMVKKAQLEIQSLKLHIKEQLKRGEDFTNYDEP